MCIRDRFSTQEERDEAKREFIADIPLEEISDFPDHPYKVKQDESMLELAASIREKGVVNPAPVSYTHLDVYKRQGRRIATVLFRLETSIPTAFIFIEMSLLI